MQQSERRAFVDAAALRLDDAVLDLIAHPESVPAADRVRLEDEFDRRGERRAVDRHRPALLEPHGDVLGRDVDGGVPVGDTHDRRDDLHRRVELFQCLGLVRRPPDVGVGRVGLLGRVAVGEVVGDEELAHAPAATELVDEVGVEPGLVDPQVGVDEQPVAVETLDVVALVRRTVAPDVDAVVAHRPDEERSGDRPAERGRVEVGATGRPDVERPALEGDEALADQFVTAVDETGLLGAVELRPIGHGVEFGLVVLAEVGGVGVGDRPAIAHPGDRRRRVETAGEGDTDALADRERHQDLGVRGRVVRAGALCARRIRHGGRRYPCASGSVPVFSTGSTGGASIDGVVPAGRAR